MVCSQTQSDDFKLHRIAVAVDLAERLLDEYINAETSRWGETLPQMIMPLREAVRTQQVDGWVADLDGHPLGLITYDVSRENGRIHFIHILDTYEGKGLAERLIEQAVVDLRQKGARRIAFEAPVTAHEEAIGRAFARLGFQVIGRMTMSLYMEECPTEPPLPAGVELCRWDDRHLEGVIQVIHSANLGTLDELVYPGLGSVSGTNRLVQTVLKGAAGTFDEEASVIAVHAGIPCGVVLFTRPAFDRGIISEIAVASAQQSRGLGRALLCRALAIAYAQGIRALQLGVTEQNTAAVRLYRQLGFQSEQRITAYVWRERAAETVS